MDARGAPQLRQPTDLALDVLGGDHHHVGQLVDDDDQVAESLGGEALVEGDDVARADLGEARVASLHLEHRPAQGGDDALHVGDDRQPQVRQALVLAHLDLLGVDQDQLDLVGRARDQQ